MSGTGQLHGSSDQFEGAEAEIGESPDRSLWEAREEITELRTRLAEEIERERILELEIAAAQKDLAVKVEYATALEDAAEERKEYIQWLQTHYDRERARADATADELAAERARLYYRLFQPLLRAVRSQRRRG